MKKYLLLSAVVLSILFTACGPAAENRAYMHSRAKTISDSMANLIKTAMAEAEMPAYTPPVNTNTAAAPTNTTVNTPK